MMATVEQVVAIIQICRFKYFSINFDEMIAAQEEVRKHEFQRNFITFSSEQQVLDV